MTVRMKCPRCQGEGQVKHPRQGGAPNLWGRKIRCPNCRGTGKVAVR